MNADIAIILLNWNGWRDTIECLESLTRLAHTSFAVVVIDNASSDGSKTHIMHWLENQITLQVKTPLCVGASLSQNQIDSFNQPLAHRSVTLIQADANGGFAAGNNLGLRLALNSGCQLMWLLNNDTVVDPDALTALELKMREGSTTGIVGSVICFYDQPDIIQAVGGVQYSYWRARGNQVGQGQSLRKADLSSLAKLPLSYIAGASMLVSKPFLEDVGLMFEGYFLYFEEIDWATRAHPKWRLITASNSLIFHKEGSSIGTSSRGAKSLLAQYYLIRNAIVFFRRHHPLLLPLAIANIVYESFKMLLSGERQLASSTIRAVYRGLIGETGKSKIK